MIKIQIKTVFGELLFEYEKENNTLKDTLNEAIRHGVNLRGADLRYVNLRGADLHGADLRGADLHGADLHGADLRGAELRGADLHGADLHGAELRGADLHGAELRGVNLRYVNLRGADLRYVNLRGADLQIAQTRILPEGDIIGYKKCRGGIVIKLLIPKEAKRSHAFGRKCRAEYAEVVEIYGANTAYSQHDPTFMYKVGNIVKPTEPFDEDWTNECSTGIHFFITKIEAENY